MDASSRGGCLDALSSGGWMDALFGVFEWTH